MLINLDSDVPWELVSEIGSGVFRLAIPDQCIGSGEDHGVHRCRCLVLKSLRFEHQAVMMEQSKAGTGKVVVWK